jgi:hypothetical protein
MIIEKTPKNMFSKKNITFVALFVIIGLVALQLPLYQLAGSNAKFTLFDAFGPVAGGFIGTTAGMVAVFFMQVFNFLLHGAKAVDTGSLVRLFPMIFAAMYFSKKTKFNILIPILAIISFNLNPVGRSVWYFSLYWLIPVVCYFFQEKSLLARSLGSTFTAHAVGGAAWIWVVHMSKAMWVSLIPIVAMERAVFAVGIAATYFVLNNVFEYLMRKQVIKWQMTINQKYLLI